MFQSGSAPRLVSQRPAPLPVRSLVRPSQGYALSSQRSATPVQVGVRSGPQPRPGVLPSAAPAGPDPRDGEIARLKEQLLRQTALVENLERELNALHRSQCGAGESPKSSDKLGRLRKACESKDEEIRGLTQEVEKLKKGFPQRASQHLHLPRSAAPTPSGNAARYHATVPTDPTDVRLEEFMSGITCPIRFHRINQGLYRFGATQVELEIVNQKLMARTDDGWNRGKLGPIERFIAQFEPIERDRFRLS
mmetsp:Transcript_83233/g.222488  ORF Transcript_83233/g.222488 Transcript_83233/m.222488 type:complete len:250 (+) Transcript_83233:3-752(+)